MSIIFKYFKCNSVIKLLYKQSLIPIKNGNLDAYLFSTGSVIIGTSYAFIPPKVLKKYSNYIYDSLFHINTVLSDWQTNSYTNNEFAGEETDLSGGVLQCTPGRYSVGGLHITEYHYHANADVTAEMPKIDLAEVTLTADKFTFIDHLGYLNCNPPEEDRKSDDEDELGLFSKAET